MADETRKSGFEADWRKNRPRGIDLDRLRRAQEKLERLPVVDDRPPDELLDYDETGLPK